jgi:signal transduction histidine kinase
VHALLDECLAFAQAKCETPGIEVVRAYDAACPEALLDARELRKAFLNLVLNGLEALTAGGRLTVTTAYAAETRTVMVTIEDTGAGMSEETLSRMFDLFFTTKPQGTGLGMALARSVIDLHAGALSISSAPGKGTRVTVRLPIEPANADGARA